MNIDSAIPAGSTSTSEGFVHRLSGPQLSILAHEAISNARGLYTAPMMIKVEGVLSIERLTRSLEEIVQRHPALRMQVVWSDGEPGFRIPSQTSIKLGITDLRSYRSSDRTEAANVTVKALANEPIEADSPSLTRFNVLRLTEREWIFFANVHHIAFDDRSIGIFLSELFVAYSDVKLLRPQANLISFPDYVLWQNQLSDRVKSIQLRYWEEKLLSLPPSRLDMYQDAATDPDMPHCVTRVRGTVTTDAIKKIDELARATRTSRVAVLCAVFELFNAELASQSKFPVGYIVSGRHMPQTEALVGLFVNTLILAAKINRQGTFIELLHDCHDDILESYCNQDVALLDITATLAKSGRGGAQPLFQVCFNYHDAPRFTGSFSDLRVTELAAPVVFAKFKLLLDIYPNDTGELDLFFELNQPAEDSADSLCPGFLEILDACLQEPNLKLSSWLLSSEAKITSAVTDDLSLASVHGVLTQHALHRADKVAIYQADRIIRFNELDQITATMAASLQRRGIGTEDKVGVLMDRTADAISLILAILRVGACYVPLDRGLPAVRLGAILENADLRLLVSDSKFELNSEGPPIILIGDLKNTNVAPFVSSPILEDSLAYVIYTSGSTGSPKGVQVTHGNLKAHIRAFCRASAISSDDVSITFSSLNFDGSVEEIFCPLWLGGTIVVIPDPVIPFDILEEQISRRQVTLLDFTAGYWSVWIQHLANANLRVPESVRNVIVGGERITENQLRTWSEVCGSATLHITYGPTECTVIATHTLIAPSQKHFSREDGILGFPLVGYAIYLMDEHLCAVETRGEIFISGKGVARGYLGDAALTADRFMPDPFSKEAGSRMYRTGDIAERRHGVGYVFLGRNDHQVKIRGFRIELSEIEICLLRHPGVASAVAITVGDGPECELVAFLVMQIGIELDSTALSRQLRATLPDYMVPTNFIKLNNLPILPSGKIDRTALNVLAQQAQNPPAELRSMPGPDSDCPNVEFLPFVVKAFSEVLRREAGPDDNFFASGGHSLSVLKVLARIRDGLGIRVPMKVFFLNPTATRLTTAISGLERTSIRRSSMAVSNGVDPAKAKIIIPIRAV